MLSLPTIGITGGTGFIGSNLVLYLINKGYKVECLTRSVEKIPGLNKSDNIHFSRGDITIPGSLKSFVRRSQIIIHLAGKTRAKNEDEFLKFNVEGTKNLLNTIKSENPDIVQIIIMSSQAAVGPGSGNDFLDEKSPLNPISSYGRSKAIMEKYLQSEIQNLPITIIRAPSVYGPGDKDFLRLFRIYNLGIIPVIGKTQRISFVYIENLLDGIFTIMTDKRALKETFFITDRKALTLTEFGELSVKYLDKSSVKISIPVFILDIIGLVSKIVSLFTKNQPLLNREKLKEIKTPFWMVSNKKIAQLLGYTPQVSTEEGLKTTINWYKNNNFLK